MIEAKVQKWGNSYGIRIPKGELEDRDISENDIIIVNIDKKESIRDLFGIVKFKESIKDIVKDAKRGSF